MLADLKSHVDDFVNGVGHGPGGPGGRRGGPGGGPFDLTAVTDYLGLTAAQLRTQLEAGKSLADVAKAQGKTVAGLEDAIVAAATKKLDAAVAAGKLTAAQEATMLADLKSHVDDMVNRTGPPRRRPRRPRPLRPAARAPRSSSSSGTTTNRDDRPLAIVRNERPSPGPDARASADAAGSDVPELRPRRARGERHRFASVRGFGYLRCQRRSRCSRRLPASMPTTFARVSIRRQGARGAGFRHPPSDEARGFFSLATHEGATRDAHDQSNP